ncbi:MAG: hypothetical protein ABGY71_01795 [bacterium]|jgi:hypothetical protein|nr:hypothetical protein [Planctomycetota bacterium]HIL52324.1 hypothetical protein [Planctomycetota bacterium]
MGDSSADHHQETTSPAWLLLLCGWLIVGAAREAWRSEFHGRRNPAAPVEPLLDLESASVAELRGLPSIGPRRATDFARLRWAWEEGPMPLQAVPGIGPLTAAAVREALGQEPSPATNQANLGE